MPGSSAITQALCRGISKILRLKHEGNAGQCWRKPVHPYSPLATHRKSPRLVEHRKKDIRYREGYHVGSLEAHPRVKRCPQKCSPATGNPGARGARSVRHSAVASLCPPGPHKATRSSVSNQRGRAVRMPTAQVWALQALSSLLSTATHASRGSQPGRDLSREAEAQCSD